MKGMEMRKKLCETGDEGRGGRVEIKGEERSGKWHIHTRAHAYAHIHKYTHSQGTYKRLPPHICKDGRTNYIRLQLRRHTGTTHTHCNNVGHTVVEHT